VRFLLDNDVDVAVGRVLRSAGHECWTAAEANLAGHVAADDDEVSVYAHDKSAVVITHDREFSQRRLRNTFGKHVWLRCEQPDAASLIARHLDDLVQALNQHEEVVVMVSFDGGVEARPPSWR
jgi:predicted nuclease of predicted toxin-antitoxin system